MSRLKTFIETQDFFFEAQYGHISKLKRTEAASADDLVKCAVLPKLAMALEALDLNPSRSDFKLMLLLKNWDVIFGVPETVSVFEK